MAELVKDPPKALSPEKGDGVFFTDPLAKYFLRDEMKQVGF